MSVASRNPFDLLSDETAATPSVPAPSAEKAATKDTPSATPQAGRGGQRGRGPASRGGRYYQRGGAAAGGKPATGRETGADGEETPAREGKRSGDERGRGGKGGRGRGDRGARPGRGRVFDRHSATGKTDSEKKIHQGWGGDEGNTELKAEVDGSKDAAAEVAPTNDWANDGKAAAANDGWGVPAEPVADAAAQDAAPTEGRRPREEEEDNTLTLEQYLAQQKERSTVPKLETIRKPNEGVDDALWKDAVPLSKSTEDEYFAAKAKSAPKQRAKANEKVYLEIEARFERPQRGGRGGRGEGRGGSRGASGRDGRDGRGGRGGRGGRDQRANGHSQALDVDDQSAFPSLS